MSPVTEPGSVDGIRKWSLSVCLPHCPPASRLLWLCFRPSVSVRVPAARLYLSECLPACLPVSVRVPACLCLPVQVDACLCLSQCLPVCPIGARLCLSECLPVSVRVSTRLCLSDYLRVSVRVPAGVRLACRSYVHVALWTPKFFL